VIQHPTEALRPSGTARLATLALTESRTVRFEHRSGVEPGSLGDLRDTWLLYPGGRVFEPTVATRPLRLIVLDGSWREARRMLRRVPELWALERFTLPAKANPPLRLRRTETEDRRSTLESIADALELLEGDPVATPLRALHELFVERSLKARGAWSYRGPGALLGD
jgi:DTW domain-containing protein YfiP